ncbi:MAG: serine hydrolase domain-containing protein [Gammaproteobacteria bacterium]
MSRLFAIVFAISFALVSSAQAASQRPVDKAWAQIVDEYQTGLKAQGAVGSALVVSQDGRVLKAAYYGSADKATAQAVDADTLFHWASITKLFTAVAVLQLRDRGKLSLDERIVDYLPEYKQVHNPFGKMSDITLRHLLTHSSGMRVATFPWRGDSDWAPHEPAKWSQVAAMMPYSEILFAPGSRYGYSNPGMSSLGRVVEEITGEDIESYVTKNILMPLGMSRSYFDTTPYFLRKHRSNNYYLEKGVLKENGLEVETGATSGNGGLNGPVSDLLKFANFLLGVGDNGNYDSVLSRATIAEMSQPLLEVADETLTREHYGLGAFVVDEEVGAGKSLRFVGHTGSQVGFTSFVYIQPETRGAVVFALNTHNMDIPHEDTVFARTRTAVFTRLFPLLQP